MDTFRNAIPYSFCPGCGHGLILDQLNAALVKLQLDPHQTVIVSDIGCVGLADPCFITNTFHGLHGRSVAYASGIKLANPELAVIVLIGDGGCGIGGTHLVNAARRNIGVTTLVFNNLNFGMTGGEHSVTTPQGSLTATTRAGNLERPLDLCATVAVNGASYVYRGTAFDPNLADRIAEAIQNDGFSLLDIWELCTAYFAPSNDFSRKKLTETLSEIGFPTGIVHRQERSEYAKEYRRVYHMERRRPEGESVERGHKTRFTSDLKRRVSVVIAGSAGGKVRSSARLLGQAATLCGLWAAQRDEYPVTVSTGHSVSDVVLSPQEVRYAGVHRPDVLIVLSESGRNKITHYLSCLTPDDWLFVAPEFAGLETSAHKVVVAAARAGRRNSALAVMATAMQVTGYVPVEALQAAARLGQRAQVAEENLRAIEIGVASARPASET
jgi:2-oxoglutarate/2-oxoacid ferredoxin oxidoreductase subunit beta